MEPGRPSGEEGPSGYREQGDRQVSSVVDASVHGDEALQRGLVLHVGVVEAGVQHDDGEGQDVARVWRRRGTLCMNAHVFMYTHKQEQGDAFICYMLYIFAIL